MPARAAQLVAATRHLFGPDVIVAGGRVDALQAPLLPGEAALIARAMPTRRADFTAGRTAARIALRQAGRADAAILRGPHGAPVWPAGVVGAISHSDGLCLAVLAAHPGIRGLGVDIEPARSLPDDMISAICDPAERAALDGDPGAGALRIFGAKEAIYKAQFPLSGALIGFDAVTVRLTAAGFTAIWQQDCGPFRMGDRITGRQADCAGMVLSAVTLAPATS